MMPRWMPSSRQMSKCSRVCGLIDSLAATVNSSRSMPPTPASIFLMKRSCPGTSTNPSRNAGVSSRCAKPRSIVIPRRFFLQPVGVDPRQRLHQRRLSVIDMSRRSDDDVLHALVTV